MRVVLGPMEGVLDHLMRHLLCEINQYDMCVTEFVRVVDLVLPKRVYLKYCPELENGGFTPSGTPVRVQLLGQAPEIMAANAANAIEYGSFGIDLNFGCPSKLVNGSNGGAALLKQPELIYQVVKAVREAVPQDQVVSAKVRLGFDDCSTYPEIVDAVVQGGANELVVHGRSKADGYRAGTIRWDLIGEIARNAPIHITANGDVWNWDDGQKCMEVTGCDTLMVCRGALNMPNLGRHLKENVEPMHWLDVLRLMLRYSEFEMKGDKGLYYPNRIKQWLTYLRHEYPQAQEVFTKVRVHKVAGEIVTVLQRELDMLERVTV